MDRQAIIDGEHAHRSVPRALRGRPEIVLSRSRRQTPHRIAAPIGAQHTAPPKDFRELRDVTGGAAPRWDRQIPNCLPDPSAAYDHAGSVGYLVDRESYRARRTSHSEELAWMATRGLLEETSRGLWTEGSYPDRIELRNRVSAVVPYFIVPDLDGAHPYLVDQLWIVAESDQRSARWIALEIDGEKHLEDWLRRRDAERTEALYAMGFEVIRIAAWWFRVDPFRAIVSFMREAQLVTEGETLVGEDRLRTISDYVCDCCHNPMHRLDELAIEEIWHDDRTWLVHEDCAADVLHGDWMPEGARRKMA
jgi:uncharacterized membrane protein YbaN (DUF454 family)